MSKVKYVVVSKFAHFKVGQVVELDEECPSAAQAHVKRHVELEASEDNSVVDSEALAALGELYTIHTGDKAGKKGVKTLLAAIIKSTDELKTEIVKLTAVDTVSEETTDDKDPAAE